MIELEAIDGTRYTVAESDLCRDCTTPAIDVDADTLKITTVYHDPDCPYANRILKSRERVAHVAEEIK